MNLDYFTRKDTMCFAKKIQVSVKFFNNLIKLKDRLMRPIF